MNTQTNLSRLAGITTKGAHDGDGWKADEVYWFRFHSDYLEPYISRGSVLAMKPVRGGIEHALLSGAVHALVFRTNSGMGVEKIVGHLTASDKPDCVRVYSDKKIQDLNDGIPCYNDIKKRHVIAAFRVIFAGKELG